MDLRSREYDEHERADLIAEDRAARMYRRRLNAAPDCRDPDHPGCERCVEEEEEEGHVQ